MPALETFELVKFSGNLTTVAGSPIANRFVDLDSELFGTQSFKTDSNGNFNCHLKVPLAVKGGSETYSFNAPIGCSIDSFNFYVSRKQREYLLNDLINQKTLTYFSLRAAVESEIPIGECAIWFDHTQNQLRVLGRGLSGELYDTSIH